jgi:hypothetical protein
MEGVILNNCAIYALFSQVQGNAGQVGYILFLATIVAATLPLLSALTLDIIVVAAPLVDCHVAPALAIVAVAVAVAVTIAFFPAAMFPLLSPNCSCPSFLATAVATMLPPLLILMLSLLPPL